MLCFQNRFGDGLESVAVKVKLLYLVVFTLLSSDDTRRHHKMREGGVASFSRAGEGVSVPVTTRCHFHSANFIPAGMEHPGNVERQRGRVGKRGSRGRET